MADLVIVITTPGSGHTLPGFQESHNMATKTRGRPQGARTLARIVVSVDLSQCPRCGSYMRTPYKNKKPIYIGTTQHNGRQYSWILQRDTTCRNCGQPRTDESRVYQHGGNEQ